MIVVVGDALLDIDIEGETHRLTPDAPVPVLEVAQERRRAGGAGLVAAMLARDGAEVCLVTALSDDERAAQLRGCLAGVQVVAGASHAPTPVKIRIGASAHPLSHPTPHPMVRIDEGCETPPLPDVTEEMTDAIRAADAVLVSDYGRRLVEHPAIRLAVEESRAEVVVWDPHRRGPEPVPGTTVVTPNAEEAGVPRDGAGRPDVAGTANLAERLRERWRCEAVAITLGARGALLVRGPEVPGAPARGAVDRTVPGPETTGRGICQLVPAPRIAACDPCGAGDRFASALASRLAAGRTTPEAVADAVTAASLFLESGGVRALPPLGDHGEVRRLDVPAGDALEVVRRTRERGGTVVATGGCFDLVHAGHARTLHAARALGDCLVVCLNSDASVRRLKGAERPILGEDDRRDLLLSMESVDAVAVFEEDGPDELLRRLEPDIWVKGGDYVAGDLPEASLVGSWGGVCVTVPYVPARSTTGLAAALQRVG